MPCNEVKCTLTAIFKIRSNTQSMLWFEKVQVYIVYIKKAKNFENRAIIKQNRAKFKKALSKRQLLLCMITHTKAIFYTFKIAFSQAHQTE